MAPQDQNKWLCEHIPHRLKASIACLSLQDDLIRRVDQKHALKVKHDCHGSAIMQGRMAAIRWLIEFIGVGGIDFKGNVKRSEKRFPGTDRLITDFGGQAFDLSSPEAIKLGKVWDAISKACGHATDGTGHHSLEEPTLVEAVQIIMGHLDRTIYASVNQRLDDVVVESCKKLE